MRLIDLVSAERVDAALVASDKRSTLRSLATLLARGTEGLDEGTIAKVLEEREALASTGVGDEVAIPHGRIAGLTRVVAALGLSKQGVDFDAIDRRPVRIFVAILAPERSTTDHLRALARFSRLLRDAKVRERLMDAKSNDEAFRIIADESEASGC